MIIRRVRENLDGVGIVWSYQARNSLVDDECIGYAEISGNGVVDGDVRGSSIIHGYMCCIKDGNIRSYGIITVTHHTCCITHHCVLRCIT